MRLDSSESQLITVREAASQLGVSESWVRRHVRELPTVRVGRLVRFDSALLSRQFEGRKEPGNRLRTERVIPLRFRRYQQGRLTKLGKAGKQVWYGVFRVDVPQLDGPPKRKQKKVRLGSVADFPTKAMALELLRTQMNARPSATTKVRELVARWEQVKKPTIRESTALYYQKMLDAHVLPHFGETIVSNIEKFDVEQFLAGKAAKGYRENTLRGMRVSLGVVLSWAVENHWIPSNPCAAVALPKTGTKVVRTVLTPENILAISAGLEEPYSTFVLFMAITGLRISEATGVRWSDIEGNVLHLQQRVYEGKAGPLKSRKSRRDLTLEPELIERMRSLSQGEYVFRARNGAPLNPKNVAHRHLRPVLKKLGLKMGGWHDFRHTFTTLALREHPLKAVSMALGHANTKITTEVYQHINADEIAAPFQGMSRKLLPSVTKTDVPTGSEETKYLN